MKTIEFIIGALLTAATLLDVFATVVIPGRVRVSVGIPGIVRSTVLPAWRVVERLVTRQRTPKIPTLFAGALLFFMFLTWLLMLMTGLSLMMHARAADFSPRLPSFPEAVFQIGSSMMTLGISSIQANGLGRFVVVLAGMSGLQVITLTLTYIVQLQMALGNRDPLVLRLSSRAGRPSSPVELLLTQQKLGLDGELSQMFDRWEQWTADIQHTHNAHPILCYFRSDQDHGDWVTALGTVLDAAAVTVAALDGKHRGHAELLLRGGTTTARQLCELLGLDPERNWKLDEADVAAGLRRLRDGGFELRDERTEDRINSLREPYAASIDALASHFGVDRPNWSRPRNAQTPTAGEPPSNK